MGPNSSVGKAADYSVESKDSCSGVKTRFDSPQSKKLLTIWDSFPGLCMSSAKLNGLPVSSNDCTKMEIHLGIGC